MSYLVLARKWRPRRFAELVGQEHVVRALTNALGTGRVHHAFLFTGTRGVGKTTIARIFAKSLNCESGTSADPCGECATCVAIDGGRFIDLLEIDAASNTGVDDVRDLIDNAQYMPARGRMKVYLIDEVHMLSKAAFNALLKTLEEPPGHVKFLLATTDPQKLPVTVLSRCLQFNLKRLDEAQIGGQIEKILAAEGITVEPGAVRQLARAADGSLRDGLSLLDQAIAYTGARSDAEHAAAGDALSADGVRGTLSDAAIATMLGTVDRGRVGALLDALAQGDGATLMAEIAALGELSPDWAGVLEALADALHRVQVRQLVPTSEVEADGVDLDAMASALRPELVQLWYQMALSGRRDLPLAPSARAGFEMSLLRMLAFRPLQAMEAMQDAAPTAAAMAAAGSTPGRAPGAASVAAAKPVRDDVAAAPVAGRTRSATSAPPAVPRSSPAPPEAEVPDAATAPIVGDDGDGDGRAAPSRARSNAAARHTIDDEAAPPWAEAVTAPPASPSRAAPIAAAQASAASPSASVPVAMPAPRTPAVATSSETLDADGWLRMVAAMTLRGPARELAAHAAFVAFRDGVLSLSLPASDDHLKAPFLVQQLANALEEPLGCLPAIRFTDGDDAGSGAETLHARRARERDTRQGAAESAFLNDPHVQRLMTRHGARVVPDSIRHYDD